VKDAVAPQVIVEDDRTGMSLETLKRAINDNLYYIQGKFTEIALRQDFYMAVAYTVRDRLLHRWLTTAENFMKQDVKAVAYLSAEFLMGPHLGNNLINMGSYDRFKEAVSELGLNLEELISLEAEPGLGNGGLGRLAACYMDSLATLDIPAVGYGIRYEFGIFEQQIKDGWQVEVTDKWLHDGNPWELRRPEIMMPVRFGGYTETFTSEKGERRVRWVPDMVVSGIAYDTPILGHNTGNANLLRLWKAEAAQSFDFQAFNSGDYIGAVHDKMISENISKVLYPNDDISQGRQLRLEQQYFFVSCSLQDIIRWHLKEDNPIENLHEKVVIQLNDTHPSISVAEMMRLLVDEYEIGWDLAWDMTQKIFAYTNHTLLPEALERWPISLFGSLLPRHLEIIYEINARFLDLIRKKYPGDEARVQRMSLIDEAGGRFVRMAHLACVGSHAINGVAALHTELLKSDVLHDFYELWPEKFFNVTNGITPRRWLILSNPNLSDLIKSKIGDSWVKNLNELRHLEKFADDAEFRRQWREVKQLRKKELATIIYERTNIIVDPASLFDIQVKRIHEYKRQHLNVLHVIALYNRIKANPTMDVVPRTVIFGGKAAPGYYMAKLVIKLINSVAEVVNSDPDVKGRLKVVFLPNFNVTVGQQIYPAAELSEQISTAGKEASGTGNMKFSLNGALTIGTLDGANIEIREEVGEENFFLFGLTAQEVADLKAKGYRPRDYYEKNAELRQALDQIRDGHFSHGDANMFGPLVNSLLSYDPFFLLADFESYIECQQRVDKAYKDQDQWTRMSILNVARMGKFSSDRSIQEYCDKIWDVQPVDISIN